MSELLDAAAALDTRIALLVFLAALDFWVLGLVFRAPASRREKTLWTVIVVLCPVVGCVLWYVLGPKPRLVGPSEGSSRDRGA